MIGHQDLYRLQPPRWRDKSALAGAREAATLALRNSYQVDDHLPADMQALLAQLSSSTAR